MAASRCKINYNALRLPRGLRWVTAAKGYIPRGAVSSGRYRGRRVFVARVGASPSLMVFVLFTYLVGLIYLSSLDFRLPQESSRVTEKPTGLGQPKFFLLLDTIF